MSYERAMQRLEEIMKILDGTPLSETVPLIEEALRCHHAAAQLLTDTEAKVKLLCEMPDGTLALRDR